MWLFYKNTFFYIWRIRSETLMLHSYDFMIFILKVLIDFITYCFKHGYIFKSIVNSNLVKIELVILVLDYSVFLSECKKILTFVLILQKSPKHWRVMYLLNFMYHYGILICKLCKPEGIFLHNFSNKLPIYLKFLNVLLSPVFDKIYDLI